MIKCLECGFECSAHNALSFHLRKHNILYVDYVVKHQYNGIWPTCCCGTKLVHKLGGFKRFCSISCASSGSNNPMSKIKRPTSPNCGKKRTAEHRKNYSKAAKERWIEHGSKIRKTFASDSYREMQRQAQLKNYQNNPEIKEKISKSVNKFWSSDSELTQLRRQQAADRAINLLDEGKIGPQAPFKTEWIYNPFTKQKEYMHSSWETAFLKQCQKLEIPVTKKHKIKIQYIIDNISHKYIPDFVTLDDYSNPTIFEIKGQRTEETSAKEQACQEWCNNNGYEYVVIEECVDQENSVIP